MHNLGHTRSSHQPNHLLQTPDTFVRTSLPTLAGANAIVHISPADGAAFTQYTAEFGTGGTLASCPAQRFLYVLEGTAELISGDAVHLLTPGSFAFSPQHHSTRLTATSPTRIACIEKPFAALPTHPAPSFIVGHVQDVFPEPLGGDDALLVQNLLPSGPAFDFAVNTMTYAPGAHLSQVEIHVMEHGLLMLDGGGIYRLGDHWYPVTAGDFIYMAPFCPQWFGALGKQPARYLIYKDANRHPSPTPAT